MDIEQREFVRHFSKYLKQTGTFSVHGRDNYEVIIHRLSDKLVKKDAFDFNDVATISPHSKIDQEDKAYRMAHYSCGCDKSDKIFCPKHNVI